MLVLTRRVDEGVVIGDDIRVVVVEIRDTQVKLGISAPRGRSIHRDEVYRRIQEENRAASRMGALEADLAVKVKEGDGHGG